jgi:hypothetical protein
LQSPDDKTWQEVFGLPIVMCSEKQRPHHIPAKDQRCPVLQI